MGMDPFDFRMINALEAGLPTGADHLLEEGVDGIKETIQAAQSALQRIQLPAASDGKKIGVGVASAVKNVDGTVTFTFKQQCTDQDKNCLAVPANAFDLTARYYLPSDEIITGQWTMPKPVLQGSN